MKQINIGEGVFFSSNTHVYLLEVKKTFKLLQLLYKKKNNLKLEETN